MTSLESTEHAKGLTDLPHDILYIICDHVEEKQTFPLTTVARFERHLEQGFGYQPRYKSTLIALSMTCKLLRQISCPFIFKAGIRGVVGDAGMIPTPVVTYMRRLHIVSVRMNTQQFRLVVKSLSYLREAYVSQSDIFLPTLLEHPTLEVLSVRDIPTAIATAPLTTIVAPLRVLRICFPSRLMPPSAHRDDILRETRWLKTVLSHVRHTLEELFIPGESTDIVFLASYHWPRLRELVIFGACPRLVVPIWDLLGMLPRLQAFTFAPAYESGQRPVLICPSKATSHDISALRRLSISFASDTDEIFARLPAELSELALRDTPRFYQRQRLPPRHGSSSALSCGVLDCGAVLRIFQQLRTPSLSSLELVVIEDPRELEMLSHIAASCPKLASLELHRYRDAADWNAVDNAPPAISLTRLSEALAEFRALRTLRLNFEFPWSDLKIEGFYPSFKHAEGLIEVAARTVASHLPWLDTICMLGWHGEVSLRGWKMWAIGKRDGVLTFDPVDFSLLDI